MSKNLFEVFFIFLRLGLTSFGGPVAHLGYFHNEFVSRRKWMTEQAYGDLVALCQFLPGPASSQVGMAIGLSRAGIFGAIAAWIGFTLPSAVLLILFGLGVTQHASWFTTDILHSLKVVAVAVVAQALWSMGPKLCPDKERIMIALFAGLAALYFPFAGMQVALIILGGVLGVIFLRKIPKFSPIPQDSLISKKMASVFLVIFLALLIALPLGAKYSANQELHFFDSFYRAGSLVFGGGHVVLPLLQSEVVPTGWVSKEAFMAGYGAAQAIPGPLFAFSAYLGAVSQVPPSGFVGGLICLIAAFLPAFLLVLGAIPFWEKLREFKSMQQALLGINAVVVGLLLAAFYNPVWVSGITNAKDFAWALLAFVLLTFLKLPSWVVVTLSVLVGGILL